MIRGMVAAVVLVLPGAAGAQSVQDQIIAQLVAQGYSDIQIGYTLLRRLRIVATLHGGEREIIVDPTTGVILRDTQLRAGAGIAGAGRGGAGASGSGGAPGSVDTDDDGTADDTPDDDDDDTSDDDDDDSDDD